MTNIPSGYVYCDGTNGTPDLRGKFLIGSGSFTDKNGTITYVIGNTGGERLHKLSISEMPSHQHETALFSVHNGIWGDGTSVHITEQGSAWNNSVGMLTSPVGDGLPHNTLPPYVVAHWIMKL